MEFKRPIVLIPAYKPSTVLLQFTKALTETQDLDAIVVDDGSGLTYRPVFDQVCALPRVTALRHAVNLGKGAALKTGLNFIACNYPDAIGVVTADADGQHSPEDVRRIADALSANPHALILGVRGFEDEVPLRSKLGNTVTRAVVRLLIGQHLTDTQTGLRGIPMPLIPDLLRITSNRYEFELDMLIAAKHQGCRVRQEPIKTIYLDGNGSSHFNPVLDSMKIYFVLLRFGLVSLLTAILDNVSFFAAYHILGNVAMSQVVGRAVALGFNYVAARKAVFLSRERHATTLPRYIALVVGSGVLSYALIQLIRMSTGAHVMTAKVIAETLLFLANFAVQRDFVFTKRRASLEPAATDWTGYYRSVPLTAKVARRYTAGALVQAFHHAQVTPERAVRIIEIGGANSCFLDRLLDDLRPSEYHVVDTNEFGLNLLCSHRVFGQTLQVHQKSVLGLAMSNAADAVFSVGLIEHFDERNTRAAVRGHFESVKPGGVVIIAFPHPTLLYRLSRGFLECLGLWKFPDERPLSRQEVVEAITEYGDVIYEKILWPLLLTQLLIVARKREIPLTGEPVAQFTGVLAREV